MPALRELASTTEAFHKIRVRVEGEAADTVRASRVATQLYRIAQEAVTNAVKHAQTDAITIEVSADSGMTKLRIIDNGVGVQQDAPKRGGLGLRIMRYRASAIGAFLSIESGPKGGTVVTCTSRETPLPVEVEPA